MRNHLVIFASDPYIAHAFRGSREEAATFFWDKVESNNIFLRIPEDKVDLWKPAVNLMFTQCIQYLERRPERDSFGGWNGEQILLVMDEFPQIGKLGQYRTMSASASVGSFWPTLRCKNLKYIQYSCVFAPRFGTKIARQPLLPNYAVLPLRILLPLSEDDSSYAARMYRLVCTYLPEVAEAAGDSTENEARLEKLENALEALAGNPALLPQPMVSI